MVRPSPFASRPGHNLPRSPARLASAARRIPSARPILYRSLAMTTEEPSNGLFDTGGVDWSFIPVMPGAAPVRTDPNLTQIWAQDASRRTTRSGYVAPLECRTPFRQSVRRRADARRRFASTHCTSRRLYQRSNGSTRRKATDSGTVCASSTKPACRQRAGHACNGPCHLNTS
jgi:hypothetical protein